MLRIIHYLKCNACLQIFEDSEWWDNIHSKFNNCPNCGNSTYSDVQYSDLPSEFVDKLNQDRKMELLDELRKLCNTENQFEDFMFKNGYIKRVE